MNLSHKVCVFPIDHFASVLMLGVLSITHAWQGLEDIKAISSAVNVLVVNISVGHLNSQSMLLCQQNTSDLSILFAVQPFGVTLWRSACKHWFSWFQATLCSHFRLAILLSINVQLSSLRSLDISKNQVTSLKTIELLNRYATGMNCSSAWLALPKKRLQGCRC